MCASKKGMVIGRIKIGFGCEVKLRLTWEKPHKLLYSADFWYKTEEFLGFKMQMLGCKKLSMKREV